MFGASTYSFVFLMEYQNCIRWEKEHWYGQEYDTNEVFFEHGHVFWRVGALSKELSNG